jgi:hypothetical protein
MSPDRRNNSCSSAEARRSQRVLLQIPIQVRAQFDGSVPLIEDTRTLEVNAHGALISLAMVVHAGQRLILRNWGSSEEQECRVVHTQERPMGKNEVGLAFLDPTPKFWNIDFPPLDWRPFLK